MRTLSHKNAQLLRTICITVFGVFFFLSSLSLAQPSWHLISFLQKPASEVFSPLGLNQAWRMFTGQAAYSYSIRHDVVFADNTTKVVVVRQPRIGITRSSINRLHEALSYESRPILLENYLQGYCNEYQQQFDKKITRIDMDKAPLAVPLSLDRDYSDQTPVYTQFYSHQCE
jgi:hypothetical protein